MTASKPNQSPANSGGSPHVPHAEVPFHRLHVWQIQTFRDILFVGAIFALVWLGYVLSPVTVPLLVALLLAYLFEPLISWLCHHPRLRMHRMNAVSSLLLAVGGGVLILIALILPLVVGQSVRFVNEIGDGTFHERIEKLAPYVPRALQPEFESLLGILPAPVEDDVRGGSPANRSIEREPGESSGGEDEGSSDEGASEEGGAGSGGGSDESNDGAPEDEAESTGPPVPPDGSDGAADDDPHRLVTRQEARQIAEEEARQALARLPQQQQSLGVVGTGWSAISSLIGSALRILLLAFLIPFYFFFFSLYYPSIVRFGRTLIPEKNKPRALELIAKMDNVIAAFVRGRLVICLITGVLLALGWWVCGVPYAVVLGLAVGAMFLVPYLSGVGLPVAIGLLFFKELSEPQASGLWWLWAIAAPSIVFGIVQLIETYILTPKIAGKATNLDPVTVIVAVLAGGSLLGVYGMLLAIPLAACAKIMLTDVFMPRVNEWLKGERSDPLPINMDNEPSKRDQ